MEKAFYNYVLNQAVELDSTPGKPLSQFSAIFGQPRPLLYTKKHFVMFPVFLIKTLENVLLLVDMANQSIILSRLRRNSPQQHHFSNGFYTILD